MAAQQNLNPLKLLVFSMGIVLIGGCISLIGLAWKKVSLESARASHAAACPGGKVDLRGRGAVADSAVEGETMRLTLEKQEGRSEIVSIDLCTGKILGTLTVLTDSGAGGVN